MRMSCNGCRVLRKGCSDDCSIRPCLGWIKSPEAQANATVFLAKFYGRAGLMNLINAGPDHLRPGIFRSLLHEACGRIVNPIYGSVCYELICVNFFVKLHYQTNLRWSCPLYYPKYSYKRSLLRRLSRLLIVKSSNIPDDLTVSLLRII
ncbi:BnaC01g42010D [Brassica napus]|uniref:BnaC01g42010D protein n=1 Tax=Brassica napus TaxID=3708 RepID=A0A078IWC8_BRANA|nr:BnaC01g42010D [Brassica napus]